MRMKALAAFILIAACPATVFAEGQAAPPPAKTAATPPAAPVRRISVSVDPRLELESVVQLLSSADGDPAGFVRRDTPYAWLIDRRFGELHKHAAVKLQSKSYFKGFNFLDRDLFLLRLSTPPELAEPAALPFAFYDRAGGKEKVELWLKDLRAFSKDAEFSKTFAPLCELMAPPVAAFRSELDKADYLAKLESYAGLDLIGGYSVLLSPLSADGSVASDINELEDGSLSITTVLGPRDTPSFGIEFWSPSLRALLWNKAGHGIADPLADLYPDAVAQSSSAFKPGTGCMDDWPQCLKEHVVRAVTLRLIAREFGDAAAEEQLRFENDKNFPYLPAMVERLRDYENAREDYPTLADFYPKLLEVLPGGESRAAALGFSANSLSDLKKLQLKRYLEQVAARSGDKDMKSSADRAIASLTENTARQRGNEHFGRGEYAAALDDFDAALSAAPGDVETMLGRAVALESLLRFDESLSSYDSAIAAAEAGAGPSSKGLLASALSSRASLEVKMKRPAPARADLEAALKAAPEGWPIMEATRKQLKDIKGQ